MSNKECNNTLYRKEALAHIATPEHLNHVIAVTSPKSWILLLTLSFLVLFLCLWSIFGTINTRVEGEGILLAGSDGLYNAVAPQEEGKIIKISVRLGEVVKKGQIVAYLESSSLKNQIEALQETVNEYQQKYQKLLEDSQVAIKNRQMELSNQNQIIQTIILEQTKNLEQIEELLKIRQEAFKKGIETKQDLVYSWQQYYGTRKDIESAKERLSDNLMNENNFIDQWNERLRELDLKLKDKKQALNNLIAQQQTGQYVYSPIAGTVTNIQAQLGDSVKNGMPVLSIAPLRHSLEVVAYVSVEEGKKIKKNMPALVTPSIIKKEEFGSILGTVIYVGEYPSSSNSMNAILQNSESVKRLVENKLPLEVRIWLTPNHTTYSGLKWTSSKGPDQKITPGTLVKASIIVRKQPPISLLIPGIKKLFEGS